MVKRKWIEWKEKISITKFDYSKIITTFALQLKNTCIHIGEMAEWSIAAVLKTVELRGSGGSNPSFSAERAGQKWSANGQKATNKWFVAFFITQKPNFQAMQRNAFSQFVTQYRLNTACELFQFQNMDALKSKLPIFEHWNLINNLYGTISK